MAVMVLAAAGAIGVQSAQQPAAAQGCAWQSPTSFVANYTVTARTTYNVRAQPGLGCSPVSTIAGGQTARVVAELGDWRYLQVNATGQWGWVHRDAFTTTSGSNAGNASSGGTTAGGTSNGGDASGGADSSGGNASGGSDTGAPTARRCDWVSPTSFVQNYTVTAGATFNLRGQPQEGCTPVGQITSGQTARVVAVSGDWRYLQINATGRWGWVHSDAFGSSGGANGGSDRTRTPPDDADTSTDRATGSSEDTTADRQTSSDDTSTTRATGSTSSGSSGTTGGSNSGGGSPRVDTSTDRATGSTSSGSSGGASGGSSSGRTPTSSGTSTNRASGIH